MGSVHGLALDWIHDYFANRFQFVSYKSFCSSFSPITCGVPQGSILGPLFFLICINDLCNASNILEFILFADDTNIFYSHISRPEYLDVYY
jgi:hypothetical protein